MYKEGEVSQNKSLCHGQHKRDYARCFRATKTPPRLTDAKYDIPTAHKRHFTESRFWVRNKKRQSHSRASLRVYNRLHKRCYAAQNTVKKLLSVFTDYLLRGSGVICTIFCIFGTYLDHMSQKRL